MDNWAARKIDYTKRHWLAGMLVSDRALDVDEDVKNSSVLTDISVVRIAKYIKEVVGERSIPDKKKGAVVMKLDVEVMD